MVTLAKSWEIINVLPISQRAETSIIDNVIHTVEENIFNTCFSSKLYTDMLADVSPIAGIDAWNPTTVFIVDEYCIYQGFKYKNTSGATSTGDNPTIKKSVWTLQPKFNTAKFNDLWDKYLLEYIAYNVISPAAHYSTTKLRAGGVSTITDDKTGSKNVDLKNLYEFKNQNLELAKMVFENMKTWLLANNNYGDIAILKTCSNECSGSKGYSRFNLRATKKSFV